VDETGFIHLRGGYGTVYGRGNSRISLLEALANVLYVFNLSANMAKEGGRVHLEQSDMRLALNMAKMDKEGFSRAAIKETKYLIQKPRAEVRAEKKQGVEFPGHKMVKAAIQGHPAMLRHIQTSGCLPCQNDTAKNPQTRWRRKGTGAPPPVRRRVRTSEPTPPPPGTPTAPTGNTSVAQGSEIINLPAGYTYSHTALPCAESFEDDEDTEHDTDFVPDMLTDDGLYTICCVVMCLTFILTTKGAD
jgi:hypothetical protein